MVLVPAPARMLSVPVMASMLPAVSAPLDETVIVSLPDDASMRTVPLRAYALIVSLAVPVLIVPELLRATIVTVFAPLLPFSRKAVAGGVLTWYVSAKLVEFDPYT